MYVKVFSQILESSISVDYEQRHIFYDLLVLADREGVIDMTLDGISRRLNVPQEIVARNIAKLEAPDPESRSDEADGRRLIRLAEHRNWGWQIVNYGFYRDLVDAETLRIANRERKRDWRARDKARKNGMSNGVLDSHSMSQNVRDSHAGSQNVPLSEAEAFSSSETNSTRKKIGANGSPPPLLDDLLSELKPIYPWVDFQIEKARIQGWMISNPGKRKLTKRFVVNWLNKIDRPLVDSMDPPAPGAAKPEPFITREKIEDYCRRKHWSPRLVPIAAGKLRGDKYYGDPITDEMSFQDTMAAIYEDWTPE